jgi:hypothetical protein
MRGFDFDDEDGIFAPFRVQFGDTEQSTTAETGRAFLDAWPRNGRRRRAENLAMLPAFGGGLEARIRHSLRVGVTEFNVSLRWLGDNDATYQEKLDRVVYLYGLFVQFKPGYEPTEIIFRAVEF